MDAELELQDAFQLELSELTRNNNLGAFLGQLENEDYETLQEVGYQSFIDLNDDVGGLSH